MSSSSSSEYTDELSVVCLPTNLFTVLRGLLGFPSSSVVTIPFSEEKEERMYQRQHEDEKNILDEILMERMMIKHHRAHLPSTTPSNLHQKNRPRGNLK